MRIAIHQPNFFPWLGLFDKIGRVDTFVLFDHIQMARGKGWTSRNRILLHGQPHWLTMPIERSGCSLQAINEARIAYRQDFARKHLGTLRQAYGGCPAFAEVFAGLEALYARRHALLADFNAAFIRETAARLGIAARFVSSTDLLAADERLRGLKGNALVLALCLAIGATAYLSGEGCLDFIEPEEFRGRGIAFEFQRFVHPVYRQPEGAAFVSHLSVLDALFCAGYAGVRALLTARGAPPEAEGGA